MRRRLLFALFTVVVGSSTMLATRAVAQQEQSGSTRKVVNRAMPAYPDLARRLQISGTVKIAVVVAPNGAVKSTKVIGGSPLLVRAATDAVEKWKWSSSAQESTELVQLNFHP